MLVWGRTSFISKLRMISNCCRFSPRQQKRWFGQRAELDRDGGSIRSIKTVVYLQVHDDPAMSEGPLSDWGEQPAEGSGTGQAEGRGRSCGVAGPLKPCCLQSSVATGS